MSAESQWYGCKLCRVCVPLDWPQVAAWRKVHAKCVNVKWERAELDATGTGEVIEGWDSIALTPKRIPSLCWMTQEKALSRLRGDYGPAWKTPLTLMEQLARAGRDS